MIVVWTPEAEQDRADIWDYIAAEDPGAAVRMDGLFSDAANWLATHPNMGKTGRIPGTCELIPYERYRLAYEIDGETLWVLPWCIPRASGRHIGNRARIPNHE
ncbi:type II toxin-antitoxin system RelE/ParE family toxin [Ectothiorhodospira haloalkaliphila]|uniref:type II toxin-antitoxin system RelE/ParE family toxin n=1 Tax=Ectothiorhodospira haloalkaliphila TaxID=421628 RepID=UPI001EE7D1AF|nr:type II toxin-antitoxin system RelE/ParE family toxin [Ectothiorhodospira haloalkaliphila]